jgi:hypothetical protein
MNRLTEQIEWLREIVSPEPCSEDDPVAWASEVLASYDDDDDTWRERAQEYARQERKQIAALKPLVGPYEHDPALPPLPDGQLHGIGFIYDGDRDDRVLVAIDKLKEHPGLVALAEHEGVLRIYARLPLG